MTLDVLETHAGSSFEKFSHSKGTHGRRVMGRCWSSIEAGQAKEPIEQEINSTRLQFIPQTCQEWLAAVAIHSPSLFSYGNHVHSNKRQMAGLNLNNSIISTWVLFCKCIAIADWQWQPTNHDRLGITSPCCHGVCHSLQFAYWSKRLMPSLILNTAWHTSKKLDL